MTSSIQAYELYNAMQNLRDEILRRQNDKFIGFNVNQR